MKDAIEEYKTLFFYEKELKRVVFEVGKLKDQDEKDFKKYVLALLQPLIEEITKVFKAQNRIDIDALGLLLSIVFKDFKAISD